MKTSKRKVEVFTANCPACDEAVTLVKRLACYSCEVEVLDLKESGVSERAKRYGVRSVPAVVIDGKLASCCSDRGPDADTLRAAGLGQKA